jgi:hypothetical protein
MQSDQYFHWNYRPVWFDTVHFGRSATLLPLSTLKMEAAGYSKVLVPVEQSTRYHNYRTIIVIFTVVENLKWHSNCVGKLHDKNFTWLCSNPVFRGSTDNLLWELQTCCCCNSPYRSRPGADTHFFPPYPAPRCHVFSRHHVSSVGFPRAYSFRISIPGTHRVSILIPVVY